MGKSKGTRRRHRALEQQIKHAMRNKQTKELRKVDKLTSTPPTEVKHEFKLHIPEAQFQKIMHWVNRCDNEVSGFGSLDYDAETLVFSVRDVILVKQTVTRAETEMDASAIGKAMYRLRDEPNALKWHWHSHGRMGVFWSSTDRELITQLSREGWLLASVFNQAEEVKTAFCEPVEVRRQSMFFGPSTFREQKFIDDIRTVIITERDPELLAAWDKEFDDNVREKEYGPPSRLPGFPRQLGDEVPEGIAAYADPGQHPNFKYDKQGYVTIHGIARYNPCFDAEIEHSEFAVNAAIDEMTSSEVEFMKKYSPCFEGQLRKWQNTRTLEAARSEGAPC